MKPGYDNAAAFYDRLSGLVYGSVLLSAQQYLVNAIPAGSRVLIVGGGTGAILEQMSGVHPSGLYIDYVEVSPRMLARARNRKAGGNRVSFINDYVQNVDFGVKEYDVVITPFILDGFSEQTLRSVVKTIDGVLTKKGIWLYSDFVDTGKLQHKLLLASMYSFFRAFCELETSRLPDLDACFRINGYEVAASNNWMKGFVTAVVYKRVNNSSTDIVN